MGPFQRALISVRHLIACSGSNNTRALTLVGHLLLCCVQLPFWLGVILSLRIYRSFVVDFYRVNQKPFHCLLIVLSFPISLSTIATQNELEDALRKRKGHTDISDEDLGLPSSPITSQRNGHGHHNLSDRPSGLSPYRLNLLSNQHSPINLMSIDSSEMDDDSFASHQMGAGFAANGSSSYASSKLNSMSFSSLNTSRASEDEPAASFSATLDVGERLSHSAAKHKMAIRPTKKSGPSRRSGRISDAVSHLFCIYITCPYLACEMFCAILKFFFWFDCVGNSDSEFVEFS